MKNESTWENDENVNFYAVTKIIKASAQNEDHLRGNCMISYDLFIFRF